MEGEADNWDFGVGKYQVREILNLRPDLSMFCIDGFHYMSLIAVKFE